jgi:N utilization substance protein B
VSDAGTGRARADRAARTSGRALALQMLYSFEQNHYQDDGRLLPDEAREGLGEEVIGFATALFAGFGAERAPVDAAVDQRLENWTIHRLAVIDRAILRLGAFELLHRSDTPPKVAINEWIELAKIYGSEAKTPKLVNGVLDRIARDHDLGGLRKDLVRSGDGQPQAAAAPEPG